MNEPVNAAGLSKEQADSIVQMAYRVLLLRNPDPSGAESASQALQAGRVNTEKLLQNMLGSAEFANTYHNFLCRYVASESSDLMLDHTQNGELKIILGWLIEHGAGDKIIVDIGARGRQRSNSFDLLKYLGWQGLLFEANPSLIETIRREFSGLNFSLVHTAISNYDGAAEIFFGINDDVTSLNRSATASWGALRGSTTVDVRRLPPMLDANGIGHHFDILSIDIEGEDIKVLNDLIDLSDYRPRLVIIEVGDTSSIVDLKPFAFSAAVKGAYNLYKGCGPNLFLEYSSQAAGRQTQSA